MSSSRELLFNLTHLAGQITKRLDTNLGVHGISFSEYQVLHHLSDSPESMLPRVELARRVGLTASGVTRMLAPMEKIGLVQKEANPRDARMSLVKLSTAGEAMYQDATVTVDSVASGMVDAFTKEQVQALRSMAVHGV